MEGQDAEDGHRWELGTVKQSTGWSGVVLISWTTIIAGVEATWEAVQERADGTLRIDEIINADRQQHRRQRLAQATNVKRGMVRYLSARAMMAVCAHASGGLDAACYCLLGFI